MSPRIAVILSGCGVYDGAEIQEAVFTLLALDEAGAKYQCCAPDIAQRDVINHLTGEPTGETRNVLQEAARIARGNIVPLSEIKAEDYAGVMLPGGFGAAKNLCDYAHAGAGARVDATLQQLLRDFHDAGKPIAAVCISPVILASAFSGVLTPQLTIGNDPVTAGHIESWGARHADCPVTEFIVDTKNKIVTSPAYMLEATPAKVYDGIKKTVNALLSMT